MTRIIVASKEGLDVLQDGQLNKVVLNQPTIIQIGVSQKDIASMEKQGWKSSHPFKKWRNNCLRKFL